MNTFTVYMHICPNGKKYIGITGIDPKRRWNNGSGYSSNKDFYKDIRKFGWGNVKHKILMENASREEAEYWEEVLIKKYDTMNPRKGYNRSRGGGYGSREISEVTRDKLREASMARGTKCVCVETGEEFVSLAAAARKLGVNRSSVERSCSTNGRIAVKGFHFVYKVGTEEKNTRRVLEESKYWDWTWEW